MNRAARFLSHVEVSGECWLWTGARNRAGYGNLGPSWESRMAHRWSYMTWVGSIADGLEIDHLCKVRSCVNPDHLEPVTRGENLRRAASGRRAAADRRRAETLERTRCPKGHPFTEDNSYFHPTRGYRICRTCHKASAKKWRNRAESRTRSA